MALDAVLETTKYISILHEYYTYLHGALQTEIGLQLCFRRRTKQKQYYHRRRHHHQQRCLRRGRREGGYGRSWVT
jgi:hypothetical protein